MKLSHAIGTTVREMRTDRGLTLQDLSKTSHISFAHISDIERSKTSPSLDILDCLARGLGVRTSELMFEVYRQLKERE